MRLMRNLEHRLEALLDGVASRVFRGPIHPTELASRLIRQADLAVVEGPVGPETPNHFELTLSAADLADGSVPAALTAELARLMEEAALERGWRMNGPAVVTITTDPSLGAGHVHCDASAVPGPRPAWARLRGEQIHDVTVNRAVIGRAGTADVVLGDDTTSRRHALLWQEAGRILLRDLGASNPTMVEGVVVGDHPVEIEPGVVICFGTPCYRLEEC